MLESIVLLWMAVKMQAPLWVYTIVCLMLVSTTSSALILLIEKIQEKQIERRRRQAGMSEEAYEEFKRWVEAQKGKDDGKE